MNTNVLKISKTRFFLTERIKLLVETSFVFLLFFVYTEGKCQSAGIGLKGNLKAETGDMASATITLFKNGSKVKEIKPKGSGSYEVNLEYQNEYEIVFALPGNVTKKLIVNTTIPKELEQQDVAPLQGDMSLVKSTGGPIDQAYQNPISKLYFEKEVMDFVRDRITEDNFKSAMKQAEKEQKEQMASAKKDEEEAKKKLAEEENAKRLAEAQKKKDKEAQEKADREALAAQDAANKQAEKDKTSQQLAAEKKANEEAKKKADEEEAKLIATNNNNIQIQKESEKAKANQEAAAREEAERIKKQEALAAKNKSAEEKAAQEEAERKKALDQKQALLAEEQAKLEAQKKLAIQEEKKKEYEAEKKRKAILVENADVRVVALVAYTAAVKGEGSYKFYGYVNFGDGKGSIELTESEYKAYEKKYPEVYNKEKNTK